MTKILFLVLLFSFPIFCSAQLTAKDEEILRKELAFLINNLRESKGLSHLIPNDTLRLAAKFHSLYMVDKSLLTHQENKSKYATPKKRVTEFGGKNFQSIGENILYSKPQTFPLKKKDLIILAEEMFDSWLHSPPHYRNMTEPEFSIADLGFETDTRRKIVFATHVFGKIGYQVSNQVSENAFGLVEAPKDCEEAYEGYANLVINMGNDFRIEGKDVILYYSDIDYFKKIFSGPRDGIAIDLISKNQVSCGVPNQLDVSLVHDGILLEPFYSNEMLQNNSAKSDYRVITKVGEIPNHLEGQEFSPSMILIKDGKACKYLCPAEVPSDEYELRPVQPFIRDEASIELVNQGVIQTQIIKYDFLTNQANATQLPTIKKLDNKIHSITIKSFSSVEGESLNNEKLHNLRAEFIKEHVVSQLNFSPDQINVDAKENWEQMDFQLNYFERDELANLSHDSLKAFLANRDNSLPWDSLLFSQRKSLAVINYLGKHDFDTNFEGIEAFNLRTAVATDNVQLANKALFEMYKTFDFNKTILFEPQIVEFMKMNPKAVGNYSAVLSHFCHIDPHFVTDFIHGWLGRFRQLDDKSRANLIHLYTMVGNHLLNNWDVSSERLSNVIHPSKIEGINTKSTLPELVLNLHLTFIKYYGQINDGRNISKSFNYIAEYFKENALKPEDDVDLTLFFNHWSMYSMTVNHLISRYQTNSLNENGLFILAATMNFTNFGESSGQYIDIHSKAKEKNPERWCEWLETDFQVKRNYQLKRMYCETCQ